MTRRSIGLGPLLALGAMLARRGPVAVVSMGVSALTVLGMAAIAASYAARTSGDAPVHAVPLLASSALAWGGGFLLAVAASAGALRRDRVDGIHHLFIARAMSLRGYLVARVGGLAALLAAIVGGGTLVTGLVAIVASTRADALPRTVHATFAAVVFALAFAVVMAPVAFAVLGARGRASGYFLLLMVLVVPELLSSALTGPLPSDATELLALPSALGALREAMTPGSVDPFRFSRAGVALAIYTAFAIVFVRREALLLAVSKTEAS